MDTQAYEHADTFRIVIKKITVIFLQIKEVMIQAQEKNFSDELIQTIQQTSRALPGSGYCLQHIICR